jgi:transcriptional regulator with XRE-family HTH domain
MKRYHNQEATAIVGRHLRKLREEKGFTIEEVAAKTGFSNETIGKMEAGSDTDITHLVDFALAIGIHPKEIFNTEFNIKLRSIEPKIRANPVENDFTAKIIYLIVNGFFDIGRFATDVCIKLREFYPKNIIIKSKNISTLLMREVENKRLEFIKIGNKHLYTKAPTKA